MENLPLIPGYSFNDCTVQNFKLKQKLNYSNGIRIAPDSVISRKPLDTSSSAYAQEIPDEIPYDPTLTYGKPKSYPYRRVIPNYVLFSQKCLNFKAYFREQVFNSPLERHRIRHVNIIYYLEDDTMSVIEPQIENAGFQQGKLAGRAKIPKNQNEMYHWKDLNVGINLVIYGVVYHTVDCDSFTLEFLRSQGIDVGEKEPLPIDSYTRRLVKLRESSPTTKRTRSADARRRFLDYDGMVLTFDAIWNDDFYQVLYFPMDDTISVKEIPISGGKDPIKMLLKRMKVPKDYCNMSNSFPSIYLEQKENEDEEYYSPMDLKVGENVIIFGRIFTLYDCDSFTRQYYKKMFNIEQPARMLSVAPKLQVCNETLAKKPLIERPKKLDVIRMLINHNKKLRYLASMDTTHPEDQGREFIIEYNLGDGKIKIYEIGKQNSGHRAGLFLSSMLIPKSRTEDDEIYYTPEDLFIGAAINIFGHRFLIKGADEFVLKYIEANPDKFPSNLIENIQNYFREKKEADQHQATLNEMQDVNPPISDQIVDVGERIESVDVGEKIGNVGADNDSLKSDKPSKQISWNEEIPAICAS